MKRLTRIHWIQNNFVSNNNLTKRNYSISFTKIALIVIKWFKFNSNGIYICISAKDEHATQLFFWPYLQMIWAYRMEQRKTKIPKSNKRKKHNKQYCDTLNNSNKQLMKKTSISLYFKYFTSIFSMKDSIKYMYYFPSRKTTIYVTIGHEKFHTPSIASMTINWRPVSGIKPWVTFGKHGG